MEPCPRMLQVLPPSRPPHDLLDEDEAAFRTGKAKVAIVLFPLPFTFDALRYDGA